MEVIETRHLEDCFDGSLIKELLIGEDVLQSHIYKLGEGGELQYFPHFAKPFFKIRMPGLFDVKGIEGNRTIRVHLKAPETFPMDRFVALLAEIG